MPDAGAVEGRDPRALLSREAETPEEHPLAAILPCREHIFKMKYPQIPSDRYWNVEAPAQDPLTGTVGLKMGLIFQFGRDIITMSKGANDFSLAKKGETEKDEKYEKDKQDLKRRSRSAEQKGTVVL